MATTPVYALPYPVGTDLIMNGDDAIKALAQRVEAVLASRPAGWLAGLRTTVDSATLGNATYMTPAAAAPVIPANRRILVVACVHFQTNTANAGLTFTIKRYPVVGGVAGAPVALANAVSHMTNTQTGYPSAGWAMHYVDTPPAGQYAYALEAGGHLANSGYVLAGSALDVIDLGALTAASRPGPDEPDQPAQPKGETP